MFDLSQPVPTEVIVGSIVFILGLVGVGLAAVGYYKRKLENNLVNSQVEKYKDINSFILTLEKYISGRDNLDNVKKVFEELEDRYYFSHFNHYLSDVDIRKNDNEYKKMQDVELEKFIVALKNESWEVAENITFLSN